MLNEAQIKELSTGAYGLINNNKKLSDYTTFHIGGECELLIEPTAEKELVRLIRYLRSENIPFYILGNGSNVLVQDGGMDGVVIRLGKNYSDHFVSGTEIIVQAGITLKELAELSFQHQLTGLEEISGIPGTVGGGVIMNAGAYGGEMKEVVSKVCAIDEDSNLVELTNEECEFEYRNSFLQKNNYIVSQVTFTLKDGDATEINAAYADYTNRRETKQPLDKFSAGSTFKRPSNGYASKLIDDAGLRGYRMGDAQVSEKHCGFLINNGKSTSREMLDLIAYVQEEVKRQFDIQLEPEVRIIGKK